jgi:hypothetical protein
MDTKTLRKVVYALMNAKSYEVELFKTLLKEIDDVLNGGEVVAQETEAPKGKGKGKATKEKVEAEETQAVETEEGDDMFGDETEEDAGPTIEDVRKVVKDFATKHGKDRALKLLGKFKVSSIPDLKKGDWTKVIELAKKHL